MESINNDDNYVEYFGLFIFFGAKITWLSIWLSHIDLFEATFAIGSLDTSVLPNCLTVQFTLDTSYELFE